MIEYICSANRTSHDNRNIDQFCYLQDFEKIMPSLPCTHSISGCPCPAPPTPVNIHAIDGRRLDANLSNIDPEKGGQQGQLTAAA